MTQAAILAASGSPGTTTGFKNKLINGNMVIDQRNAGASFTPTNISYNLDRWSFFQSQSSVFTGQQNQGSITPPVGFTKYLGFTSSTSATVSSGDYFCFSQAIEGYNVADLGWGTANAKTVTLSFWVRSSLTGQFGGSLKNLNSGANRAYPFSYTISAANTWQQVSITVAGDTSGTWATDNTTGLSVCFDLGSGSTFLGTAGSWAGTNYLGATGDTKIVATSGATFYLTGVQLEVGTTATNFDFRSIGTELFLCQRYFQNIGSGVSGQSGNGRVGLGITDTSNRGEMVFFYPVQMRSAPSISVSAASDWSIQYGGGSPGTASGAAFSTDAQTIWSARLLLTTGASFSNGTTTQWLGSNTVNAKINFSAEL